MDTSHSSRKWNNFLADRGVPLELRSRYLNYIKKLNRKNVPVIFEIEHLSQLLGVKLNVLCRMAYGSEKFHRKFLIPKRSGGKREICSPYPSLLMCQQWIHRHILSHSKVHDCAHGFVPQRSIVTNASQHLNKKALLKMDLKDFFPSIPINWVVNHFHSLDYSKDISFFLASLCTLDDKLSQGAATSPILSNILLYSFDNRLTKLSATHQLIYTRYADDLAFSGDYISMNFIESVREIIASCNLEENRSKTILSTTKGKRIVTGISVSGEQLKLPRATKRKLRQEAYYIREYGFLSHAGKMKVTNPNYLASLEGKFRFWQQLEPENEFVADSIGMIRAASNI